jgi:predicted DNA-binding protein
MNNKTEIITLRVTPELKKRVQALADKDQRTVSNYIQMLLEKITEKKK